EPSRGGLTRVLLPRRRRAAPRAPAAAERVEKPLPADPLHGGREVGHNHALDALKRAALRRARPRLLPRRIARLRRRGRGGARPPARGRGGPGPGPDAVARALALAVPARPAPAAAGVVVVGRVADDDIEWVRLAAGFIVARHGDEDPVAALLGVRMARA